MKRLLLVSLVVAAAAPGARPDAADVDPHSQPLSASPQQMQSPAPPQETNLREGEKMTRDHKKRDSNNEKKRKKNKGHKTEKKVKNAGQGVMLEEENMLLVASAADADAQRGKSSKKKRKKKKKDSEPMQITYFTPADAVNDADLYKFFLDYAGEKPIPENYTLPAGRYNFTYNNRSKKWHNLVVEVFESEEMRVGTAECANCTNSTGIVKLKAHSRVFFHCEPHEGDPYYMGFNATIVKST